MTRKTSYLVLPPSMFEVSEHAIDRWIQRWMPAASRDDAVAALNRIIAKATFVEQEDGNDQELWLAASAGQYPVVFVVSHGGVVRTILPPAASRVKMRHNATAAKKRRDRRADNGRCIEEPARGPAHALPEEGSSRCEACKLKKRNDSRNHYVANSNPKRRNGSKYDV